MTSQTKFTFGYFYPTSPHSETFNMPKGGYYVAEINQSGFEVKTLFAFKTEKEAMTKCVDLFKSANFPQL